jgi:hypothetical protein
MKAPDKRPETLCMAPWTHTYLSPQTERRMCCASREPAQNFQQYIDTAAGTGRYIPLTLDQHWNSEHMRSVRRRMMTGETLPECEVCDNKLLNTDVYRDYFWHLFRHRYDEIWNSTDDSGHTSMRPVSWDYRFSNLCNFKCRMCGDMLSSSWEMEQRMHNLINWKDPKNAWMHPTVKREIQQFQDTHVEQEFAQAVEEHRVEEVYWVGGEPLMYEQHWRYMRRIIELGDADRVYARYNTNLSRVNYRGLDLYDDVLTHLRDWQICASLDGTGTTGEYIRTGLDFEDWCRNFQRGVDRQHHRRQMRIDFTLTLPGLTEIINIENLARRFDVPLLTKTVFAFSPEVMWSPLVLPRRILENIVRSLITQCQTTQMRDLLAQLISRPTFQEQWPDQYHDAVVRGKQRVRELEFLRPCSITLGDILAQLPGAQEWYDSIY